MEIENFTFQLLMERLEWPDMLVREQTYHAIKDFLVKNCDYKDIFITKLKTQILESKILDLLVIAYLYVVLFGVVPVYCIGMVQPV